jgi:hypothetical protein
MCPGSATLAFMTHGAPGGLAAASTSPRIAMRISVQPDRMTCIPFRRDRGAPRPRETGVTSADRNERSFSRNGPLTGPGGGRTHDFFVRFGMSGTDGHACGQLNRSQVRRRRDCCAPCAALWRGCGANGKPPPRFGATVGAREPAMDLSPRTAVGLFGRARIGGLLTRRAAPGTPLPASHLTQRPEGAPSIGALTTAAEAATTSSHRPGRARGGAGRHRSSCSTLVEPKPSLPYSAPCRGWPTPA